MKEFKVLIIEDEVALAKIIARKVEKLGGSAAISESVESAKKELSDNTFDLIYLDIHLPDGNGIDFLAEQRKSGLSTPVIVMTGDDTFENFYSAQELDILDFLGKPFSDDELTISVKKILF